MKGNLYQLSEQLKVESEKYKTNLLKQNINNIDDLKEIEIYLKVLDNGKERYIIIKYNNIPHLIGMHYFEKFLKLKNHNIQNLLKIILETGLDKIQEQYNIAKRRKEIKKVDFEYLIIRFISFFMIMNFFIETKEIKLEWFKYAFFKVNGDSFINFNFDKKRKISFVLKEIENNIYVPISIFVNFVVNNQKSERILYYCIKIKKFSDRM
ncbi:hypothetical protein ACR34G_02320 [Mycoplasma sp. 480]|uniref:hypothetical protein n=1 Tax=Mycoplasma sp. 480 TaxID=3440155 RepID=UPI003F50F464